MDETGGKAPPTTQLRALESWRGKVMQGILTVAAIVAPLVILISLWLRSTPYTWSRIAPLVVVGAAFPILRLVPCASVVARAAIAVGLLYAAGVISLTTVAFSSGAGVVFLGTAILATVFLGRGLAILMIGLSSLAFFAVGELSVRGVVEIPRLEIDPGGMRNWLRTGTNFAFLAGLLTLAVDYVIRRVEHSSRAATEALTDLRSAYERLALLHERLDAAKEEERRFVATELHDELGQLLTVIKIRLRMSEGGGPAAGEPAETVKLVDQAIDRVRKISRDLRPPLLDEVGLVPALRAHVESQAKLSGVPIELETGGPEIERLPAALEIACFRIVQESLTNALRHASASRIRVRVSRRPSTIALEIVDDGKGFDSTKLAAVTGGHLGVIGMQERVRARGGTLRVSSAPGAGTRVEVEVPVEG